MIAARMMVKPVEGRELTMAAGAAGGKRPRRALPKLEVNNGISGTLVLDTLPIS